MICPKCGKETPDNHPFCGHCGEPLGKEPEESVIVVQNDGPKEEDINWWKRLKKNKKIVTIVGAAFLLCAVVIIILLFAHSCAKEEEPAQSSAQPNPYLQTEESATPTPSLPPAVSPQAEGNSVSDDAEGTWGFGRLQPGMTLEEAQSVMGVKAVQDESYTVNGLEFATHWFYPPSNLNSGQKSWVIGVQLQRDEIVKIGYYNFSVFDAGTSQAIIGEGQLVDGMQIAEVKDVVRIPVARAVKTSSGSEYQFGYYKATKNYGLEAYFDQDGRLTWLKVGK